jgi:hypothetical protein
MPILKIASYRTETPATSFWSRTRARRARGARA